MNLIKVNEDRNVVFLFLTHVLNEKILLRFGVIQKQLSGLGDVILLLHKERDSDTVIPEEFKIYCFNYESLNNLEYIPIAESMVPGSTHFPVLQFFREFPSYRNYWIIEYDVIFNGSWEPFVTDFSEIKADLLASHIRTYEEDPGWSWWSSLTFKSMLIDRRSFVKSFNPLYRLSNKALSLIDKVCFEGNSGHYEALIATTLRYFDCEIVDFGGKGSFVLDGYQNKYYLFSDHSELDGTMRFRPKFCEKELTVKNKLYHPVKLLE